jgi:hypothetical protein
MAVRSARERSSLAFEESEVGIDTPTYLNRATAPASVAFGHDHLHDLVPSFDEFGQGNSCFGRDWAQRRANGLPKPGQDASINPVGLGEFPRGSRKVSHLPGVHRDSREAT